MSEHERNGSAAVRKEMGNGIAGDDREQEIDKRERIRHFLTVINIELLSSSAGVLPRKIAPKSARPTSEVKGNQEEFVRGLIKGTDTSWNRLWRGSPILGGWKEPKALVLKPQTTRKRNVGNVIGA